jgi:DNA (cytosine-5)-methyltransferase 1
LGYTVGDGMNNRSIQTVDLFCGGGGFTHGAIQAGAKVVLAIDSWAAAVKVHQLNHPSTPCLCIELGGDIAATASLIRFYLDKDAHFHLHASPPCQSLSNASRASKIEGLGLIDWFMDLVAYMKPDSWSLENVLPLGKFLTERGIAFQKLNAASYGVPQSRRRVFAGEGWMAKESHSKAQFVSVLEALPYLEGELNPAPSMADRWSNLTINKPFPTVTSQSPKQIRIEEVKLNMAGYGKSIGRSSLSHDVALTRPSNTICNNTPILRVLGDLEATRIRSLTIEETCTLQGWGKMKIPPTPSIITKKEAWQIIGNMVCPPVAKAIIEGIQ